MRDQVSHPHKTDKNVVACCDIHIWITFDTTVCVVQVGIALGFLIPPAVVKNHDELADIGHDLKVLCYGYAIGPTVVLVLLLLCESATNGFAMHHSPSRRATCSRAVPHKQSKYFHLITLRTINIFLPSTSRSAECFLSLRSPH